MALRRAALSAVRRWDRSAAAFSAGRVAGFRGFSDEARKDHTRPDVDSHDDFRPVIKTPSGSIHESIEKDIKENSIMVYMKGLPEAPQCGFSAMVVRILQHYDVPFSARNVLEDPELREGVKTFSKWPTIPQVYIQGEFVGGCDIVTSMHRSGELKDKLKVVKPDLKD